MDIIRDGSCEQASSRSGILSQCEQCGTGGRIQPFGTTHPNFRAVSTISAVDAAA